jgi:quercetin dioxygenase-like cupin family protein
MSGSTPVARLRRPARGALSASIVALLLAALVAACTSASDTRETEAHPSAPATPVESAPAKTLAQRPFISLFDSLDRHFVGDGFEPGRETIAAPIHSGVHATLYFLATRGKIPSHYHEGHEESLLVLQGSGWLVLPERRVRLEPGLLVRFEPGVCHGYEGDKRNPLKALVLMTPPVEADDFVAATADASGTYKAPFVVDVTSTDALPPLPPPPKEGPGLITKRVLDSTKFSTVSVCAVQHNRLDDHVHRDHDETAIVFAQMGYGFVRLDEVVHLIQVGSIMHIPAGSVHSVEHQAEGHLRAVTIHTPGYDGSDFVKVDPPKVDPNAKPVPVPDVDDFLRRGMIRHSQNPHIVAGSSEGH